jgi:hypothetical protein
VGGGEGLLTNLKKYPVKLSEITRYQFLANVGEKLGGMYSEG